MKKVLIIAVAVQSAIIFALTVDNISLFAKAKEMKVESLQAQLAARDSQGIARDAIDAAEKWKKESAKWEILSDTWETNFFSMKDGFHTLETAYLKLRARTESQ